MSNLPQSVRDVIEAELHCRVTDVSMLDGGMVNQSACVGTNHGALFVKWHRRGLPSLFECEADGLERLRAAGALRIPRVLLYKDFDQCSPAFLALEFVDGIQPSDPQKMCVRFAEGLARLHRENEPQFAGFGLERGNYLGASPQRNGPSATWPEFYRDNRLVPQIEIARDRGRVPPQREKLLNDLLGRVEAVLGDYDSRAALIHGDLWSGNFLIAGDEPVLIDPAVSYSDREVEIAYIELFGGFPAGFVEAYNREYPLDPGYRNRRPLLQLYPLLVHLNHFGETYGPAVESACRHYVVA